MNLSDILKDLNIPIEGEKKEEENKVDFEKYDTSKLPDDAKTVFKTMLDTINNTKNEVAAKELQINTLRSIHMERKEEKKEEKKEEEITDPVQKEIKLLKDELMSIKQSSVKSVEDQFKDGIKALVNNKDTQDVVRYVPQMKTLLSEHPTLMKDVNRLYVLAKLEATGGKTKEKDVTVDTKKKITEMSSFGNRDVASAKRYSRLEDAYEAAVNGNN